MSHIQAASNLDYRVGDQPVPGYKLIRELGRGAMGVVWLAQTDSGFDRALKVINLRQRGGKKEYRGLRTIKQRKLLHGNLLTLIDYWLKDGEGQLIPDSDDLENTDSFFMPLNEYAGPLSLTQTTSQSISATNADPRPTYPLTTQGAMTVPHTTATSAPSSQPSGDVDPAAQSKTPQRRPAQLIVAMELGHKTLDDRQKQCQQEKCAGIPADELLPYLEQSARGLDYLHREGIIHRDIKPQNIMLVGDVAKVCDYGLIVTTEVDLRKTSNAFTPLYASPEAIGEQPLTGRSDQYSLAITYVELRTGKSPYSSETASSVYAAKETGKYNLSRIRKSCVRNVLRKALSRDPNERFTTCSEFVRELENAEKSHPFVLWLAAAAAALALIAVGAALALPGFRERLIPAQPAPDRQDQQPNAPNPSDAPTIESKTEPGSAAFSPPQLPPSPPAELQSAADAGQLRLTGKFEGALTRLNSWDPLEFPDYQPLR
jgi:serine/threonine protein kinase